MHDKLLACIDDSAYTHSVCDHAAWAAQRLGAAIELLHVIDRHPETAPVADYSGNIGLDAREALLRELADIDARRGKLAQEHGRLLLDAARRRIEAAGITKVETRLRHGELVETVGELEAGVDLIVIGKRGEHADFAKLHLGSNLERVVRASRHPILVASRAFKPIAQMAIAFDGGASSRKAVEMAASHPLLRGLRCHLVTVGGNTPEIRAHLAWATTLLDAREVPHLVEHVGGHPEQVIGDYVKRHAIDLLAMGAYGHTRIRQFIVGSTTTAMIRTCLIPVLLVR